MKYSKYEYEADEDLHFYEFVSVGENGEVKKVVEYSRMNIENFYNLGFEDYDKERQKVNDRVVTNDEDSPKVLATVASTVYAFTARYPDAHIFATGSTEVRTRLYRMGITNNLVEIRMVKIDKKLNRFKGKVLFKKKLDRANKPLENADLPKIIKDKIEKTPNKG